MHRAAWALAAWLCLSVLAFGQDLAQVPALTARVTDLTGTLTVEQKSQLEQQLASFEAQKGTQLAVLIVPTTHPEAIEQYGIRVVEQWKLGRRNVDDGALLLIAKNDRQLRIEVGRGLEGALTDATSHRIITETIAPHLRQGDFYGGVSAGLASMMKVAGGEPLPPPDRAWDSRHGEEGGGLGGVIFLVFVGSMVLSALFGRALGSVLTAAGAGILVAAGGHAILLALLIAGGAFAFSFLLGAGRGGFWASPRHGGFGGFGGGFGGGGFGGGGFGGGGGGFGGGGASGRW